MQKDNIDILIDWLFILTYFMGAAVVALVIMLVVSLVVYLKTGVHIKDWIETKFPSE